MSCPVSPCLYSSRSWPWHWLNSPRSPWGGEQAGQFCPSECRERKKRTFSRAIRAWISYTVQVKSFLMRWTCEETGRQLQLRRGRRPEETHRQILPHALELIADVAVVPFFFPLGLEEVKRPLEDRQGANGGRVGNLCARSSAPSSPFRRRSKAAHAG